MAIIRIGELKAVNEIPSGNINGSNTYFVTSRKFKTNSLKVFLNGIPQRPYIQFYEYQGNQAFVMIAAPLTNDRLDVEYDMVIE